MPAGHMLTPSEVKGFFYWKIVKKSVITSNCYNIELGTF